MRFLYSLLCSLVLAAFCSNAFPQNVRILIQSSPLAGFQFHAGAVVWPQLKVGDALTLIREPENPHDPHAVRVEWQGKQLGYLPKAENREIAAELARGTVVEARIAQLREARNPWQRVLIDVFIRI